ncbi:hypothetical protein MPAR168_20185 [Methylorubrum populi]
MPKRVAFYVRVSTSDGQTTENQLRQLHEVADRSGWIVTAVFRDDGISGAKGARAPGPNSSREVRTAADSPGGDARHSRGAGSRGSDPPTG